MMGCTDFQIRTQDGAVIIGRTMEFAMELKSMIVAHPRGETFASIAPGGMKGMSWRSRYGFVAVTAYEELGISDGLNEKGLSVGLLWLPETKYQDVRPEDADRAIEIWDLCAWVLGSHANVSEVKEGIKSVRVWGNMVQKIGIIPPLHVAVHDADGNNLVIEFIDGEAKVHDNPLGVLTNSPTFEWHITNLRNYVNLTSMDAEAVEMAGVTIQPTGHGSGFLGIPGDWTPPSRFVRAAMFIHYADPPKTVRQGVNLAEHILNTVDIPLGEIKEKVDENTVMEGHTQWAVIKDLTNRVFHFRSYRNLALRAVDINRLNLAPSAKKTKIPVSDSNGLIVDVTSDLL